jgi:hypothetical protein
MGQGVNMPDLSGRVAMSAGYFRDAAETVPIFFSDEASVIIGKDIADSGCISRLPALVN